MSLPDLIRDLEVAIQELCPHRNKFAETGKIIVLLTDCVFCMKAREIAEKHGEEVRKLYAQ